MKIARRESSAFRLGSVALQSQAPWHARFPAGRRATRAISRAASAPSAPPRGRAARNSKLARLESVLFIAREPLPSRKLAQFAGLADATEARTLIRRLNAFYDETCTAFRVEEIAQGYRLLSRARFGPWIRRLRPAAAEARLSSPALETLAVVAYRQPVLRADIEAIRGVQCGEMLRQLMERKLVRIVGKSDDLGRPYLYGTTSRFLATFGLRDLEDLPHGELRRAVQIAAAANAATQNTAGESRPDEISRIFPSQEESAVSVTTSLATTLDPETLDPSVLALAARNAPIKAARDEDEDDDLDDDEEDDDDDDDEEDDDLEEDEEEWEEVDDEDEDWDEDDEDEDDDDDDDDWEDDEEEEDELEDEA